MMDYCFYLLLLYSSVVLNWLEFDFMISLQHSFFDGIYGSSIDASHRLNDVVQEVQSVMSSKEVIVWWWWWPMLGQ